MIPVIPAFAAVVDRRGTDEDDAAVLASHHVGNDCLDPVEGGSEVEVEKLPPFVDGCLFDRPREVPPHFAHEDVDLPVRRP